MSAVAAQQRVARQAAELLAQPLGGTRGGRRRQAGSRAGLVVQLVPRPGSRRVPGMISSPTSTSPGGAGANNRGAGALVSAVSDVLNALGQPHTLSSIRRVLGGGGDRGGGGGGRRGTTGSAGRWDGGDFVIRLLDILTSPQLLAAACLHCDEVCQATMNIKINTSLVAEATVRLVRLMDSTLRNFKKRSLVAELYRRVPRPSSANLRPDQVRLPVLEYVLRVYVDAYLPDSYKIRYDSALESQLLARFKPQITAFMRNKNVDLAPLIGFLVKYVADIHAGIRVSTKTPPCMLCENLPFSCATFQDMAFKLVTKGVAKRMLSALLSLAGR